MGKHQMNDKLGHSEDIKDINEQKRVWLEIQSKGQFHEGKKHFICSGTVIILVSTHPILKGMYTEISDFIIAT